MEVECTFNDSDWPFTTTKFYRCCIEKYQIPDDIELIIDGKHRLRKTNNDVTYLKFYDCTITKVPAGMTKIFPNLKILEINTAKLRKITKNDLIEYKNLEKFSCWGNEIEFLPGDLFEGFKNLEWISFYGNRLWIIEPNIFDNLESLKRIQLEHNPNYDILYSAYPKDKVSTTFGEVKNILIDKFFASDPQIIKNFILKLGNPIDELKSYTKRIKNADKKLEIMEIRAEVFEELMSRKMDNLESSNSFLNQEIQNLKSKYEEKSAITSNLLQQLDSFTSGIFGDLKSFLQNQNIRDFKIIIDNQEFLVHKFLLAARSPTLAEIIFNNPAVDRFNLVDIPVDIFKIILKFFYTDKLPGGEGLNFLHLFAAAGRLKVKKLEKYAAKRVLDEVNPDNAFDVFNLAIKYGNNDLMQRAFEEIKQKYPLVDFKEEWSTEPEKMIKVIEVLKRKEEAMKKIEEEVEGLVIIK
ncbi:unnamed protein product [Chironomus riparius]|uniref:BTB domain-containing protein n=1 Tax=Chironomus riparius TaxID=315576 RepID=A0A9N9S664_9DIPT|nr:unnamed protein product [Chironomus riparius]